jgi:SAM-dependent methyltransferase
MERALQNELREIEVTAASSFFPRGCRILELGGGNGYQAKLLSQAGFDVTSIDVPGRARTTSSFPVADYDGKTIPFPDSSFDAAFSSNVLEHIPHLPVTFQELRRVLKPRALAVHVLPTPVWRLWTSVVHAPWMVELAMSKLLKRGSRPQTPSPFPQNQAPHQPRDVSATRWATAKQLLLQGFEPHGEYPNALAELYYFSRLRWEREFRRNGFDVESHAPAGIFYTGQLLLPRLTVATRTRVARVLGSACQVFATVPTGSAAPLA